jgi:hypothetical protein
MGEVCMPLNRKDQIMWESVVDLFKVIVPREVQEKWRGHSWFSNVAYVLVIAALIPLAGLAWAVASCLVFHANYEQQYIAFDVGVRCMAVSLVGGIICTFLCWAVGFFVRELRKPTASRLD